MLLASLAAVAFLLGDVLTGSSDVTTQTESKRAAELVAAGGIASGPSYGDVVVVRNDALVVDDPAFRATVESLLAEGASTTST